MPRSIALIGGAGPMAGVLLLQKIVERMQERYHCKDDADFPLMCLVSFPFSNMLEKNEDQNQDAKVAQELAQILDQLDRQRFDLVAMACNTLHGFIDKRHKHSFQFVDMVHETHLDVKERAPQSVLVLCTSTSFEKKVHREIEKGRYLDDQGRGYLDRLIDTILAGKADQRASDQLSEIINSALQEIEGAVLLGCTELSVLHHAYPLHTNHLIIDPLDIVANKLCALSFQRG